MDGLKWAMELLDRTSSPARKIESALRSVRVATEQAQNSAARSARGPDVLRPLQNASAQRSTARRALLTRELDQFAHAQRGAATEGSALTGALGGMGGALMAVASAAIAAGVAVAGIGSSAAQSVVQLAGFQESTMVSMQTMLGSRGAAETEFDSAIRIARATPFDTRNVVAMRRQLIGAGLRDTRERDVMTGVIADLSALNPEDSTVMQRLGLAIGQIRGAGRLRGQELNQLLQAGLSREALFTEIGSAMNFRGSASAVNRQVSDALEAGRVTDRIAFAAMARAVTRMTNTSRVGEFAGNQSTTIPGLLSTLGSAVPELFLGRGADGTRLMDSPGMKQFKGFIQSILAVLDPASPTSKAARRFQMLIRGLIDTVFGGLRGLSDEASLARWFDQAIDAAQAVIATVKTLWKLSQLFGGGLFSTLGPALEIIGNTVGWVLEKFSGPDSQSAQEAMRALGQVVGIFAGFAVGRFALVVIVLGAIVTAISWVVSKVGQGITYLSDHFGEFRDMLANLWLSIPEPVRWLLAGRLGIPGLLLNAALTPSEDSRRASANDVVESRPGQSALRPVVSQPNVTVNVNALAQDGVSAQDIAGAAGAVIPGVVQASATRAGGP